MKLRVFFLERRKQVGEVAERELCIQAAGDVQFSRAFLNCLTRNPQGLVNVMGIGVRLARRSKKAAELAIYIADVGGVEMTIYVEVGRASMLSSTHSISQFA